MLAKVFEGLEVGIEAFLLRVGDEDDSVSPFQDEFAAGFVEDLAGDGVEMQARFEAADGAQIERKEVKEQRAVSLRGQGNHLALLAGAGVVVNPLQIGGLAAQTGSVVDQLAVDLACGKVDERHRLARKPGNSLIA